MLNVTRILISFLGLVVCGCASDASYQMQQGGIESKELYRRASLSDYEVDGRLNDINRAKQMIQRENYHESYTRTALNETEQLFKLLPNPKISIYVYPHLSTRDNAPVPGYTTAVSLYRSDEYALSDEVLAQGDKDNSAEIRSERGGDGVDGDVPLSGANSMEVRLIKQMNRRSGRGGES